MTSTDELKESVAAVSFWLDEKNSQARRELEQRNPPLGQWLDMIEKRVAEKLAEREAQEEVRAKA